MLKLKNYKHLSSEAGVSQAPLPKKAYLPLSQHIGKICHPLVKVGDDVSLGQKIADSQAHVYAAIHASISGRITAIQDWPHPVLGRCKAIVIEGNGDPSAPEPKRPRTREETDQLTAEDIINIVKEAGIVGMGGASFPTHIKLKSPQPLDTLIVNGAECEPYLTSDRCLMVEKANEIIAGIDLVVKCTGVKNIYWAIEDNKPEAIRAAGRMLEELQITNYKLQILRSEYPQGGEKQLIKNVLHKEVPSGKLPFDIGVLVHNVATVYAIYEAVYKYKPLYERIVTVAGSCLSRPMNLWVRLGTPIKDLIEFAGPLKEEPMKIITGGPMMGIAQYTDLVPVVKSTNGIVLMNKEEAKIQEEEFCIRCGACVRSCPAGLMPCLINLASEKALWPQAKAYAALDCIECGLCNYVCPANRRLTQSIKRAKLEIVK